MNGVSVRDAVKADMAALLGLVVGLAVFEKEPDAVTATLADYEREFEAGTFSALVAEDAGKVAGLMIFYPFFSTWKGKGLYLEDFYVHEAARGRGVGQALFARLRAVAAEQRVPLVKFECLEWNDNALKFYEKQGCSFEKQWINVKLAPPFVDAEAEK